MYKTPIEPSLKKTVFWLLALVAAFPQAVNAGITRINITRLESPTFEGRSFGSVGQYEKLVGTIHGEVDPGDRRNAGIINIARAPRNAAGHVEYDVDLYILKPIDPNRGSNHIYYDVNNRGNLLAIQFINQGGGGNDPTTAADAGTGFLMELGYTLVWSGWQADIAPGMDRLLARFPIATNAGAPIVGISREEFIDLTDDPIVATLDYPAATLDPGSATITVRQNERDPRQTPKGLSFTFMDNRTVQITRPPGFDLGAIYEFIYEARDPMVMGLAFAATRDVVSFLRYETEDSMGAPNPLAAAGLPPIALIAGVSQSGRWTRDFIFQGFNEDEQGRQVFEGANPIIAGSRKTFTNFAFAQPGRFSRQHEDHVFPNDQFPFTYTMLTDPLTGRTDSILRRCEATSTCPKIFHVDSDFEIWGARGALITTSPTGQPVLLPDNVRAYLLSSTQHGVGNATFGICQQLSNPLPYSSLPALTADLDDWVTTGQAPPPSRYPTLAEGTLVPIDQTGFPDIPGVSYPGNYNVLRVADYSVQPPFEGVAYPVFVTPVDADGNSVAGIRHPLLEVPIATYTGFNLRAEGHAPGEACSTTGSYIPFERTLADRQATGDPRRSLQERYANHERYVIRVARAAERLVRERLLLQADADRIVAAAAESQVP